MGPHIKNYTPSQTIPGVSFPVHPKHSDEHTKILVALVQFIGETLSRKINYDHVITHIPKTPLSLQHDGKKRDISFVYGNRLVFVDVETAEFDRTP